MFLLAAMLVAGDMDSSPEGLEEHCGFCRRNQRPRRGLRKASAQA